MPARSAAAVGARCATDERALTTGTTLATSAAGATGTPRVAGTAGAVVNPDRSGDSGSTCAANSADSAGPAGAAIAEEQAAVTTRTADPPVPTDSAGTGKRADRPGHAR